MFDVPGEQHAENGPRVCLLDAFTDAPIGRGLWTEAPGQQRGEVIQASGEHAVVQTLPLIRSGAGAEQQRHQGLPLGVRGLTGRSALPLAQHARQNGEAILPTPPFMLVGVSASGEEQPGGLGGRLSLPRGQHPPIGEVEERGSSPRPLGALREGGRCREERGHGARAAEHRGDRDVLGERGLRLDDRAGLRAAIGVVGPVVLEGREVEELVDGGGHGVGIR